jgi:HSP20 family protein
MMVRFDYPRTCDTFANDFFATDRVPVRTQNPALDVIENENEFVVTVDLPGVQKENVKITFENKVLTVSGSRKSPEVSEKAQLILNELRSGDFSRALRFRQDVDTAKMTAEMNNGILTITLPKAETVKAREIQIN